MSLAKRIDHVEEHHLTPREAVICWMREAHQFGSMESYIRWLADQPENLYPLMRMPAQVVGTVRARHRGVPDHKLRGEFNRVQKDVLFLYHLHSQANNRALLDHEAIQLRVIILIKEIRALSTDKHGLNQMRLARVSLEGKKHPRPGRVEQNTKALFQAHADSWLPEAEKVRTRILVFLTAAQMLSRRYLAGEDILYPATRENLTWNLKTITTLREMYLDSILGSPDSDDDFRDYVLEMAADGVEASKQDLPAPAQSPNPDVTREAKLLAEQWVLMAKSDTLDRLGEHREAEGLAERLMREYMG